MNAEFVMKTTIVDKYLYNKRCTEDRRKRCGTVVRSGAKSALFRSFFVHTVDRVVKFIEVVFKYEMAVMFSESLPIAGRRTDRPTNGQTEI